jgi:hypothetical protein
VLRLSAQGASQSEIARTLDLSPNTVKTHLRHVAEKLGATSRAEALQLATARDLVPVALQTPDRDGLVVEVLRLATARGLLRGGDVSCSDASSDSLPQR